MIDPCGDILMDLEWDEVSNDEKEERVRDWMDQLMTDWGVDGVSIEFGQTTEGEDGEYDPETNTITLDEGLLDGDTQHLLDVAAHEIGHAIQEEYLGDQLENQNPDESDPYTTSQVDANEFADAVRDDVAGDCMDPDAESASTPDVPKGDWPLSAGEGAYA